jgi:hypothetical protein
MKIEFKLIFKFLSIFLLSNSVWAIDTSCKIVTDPGAKALRDKMCSCSKDYLDLLNQKNPEGNFSLDFEKIKKLNAQKKILVDTSKLVNDYLKKFKEVASVVTDKNYLSNQIANYNSLINQAVLLKSLKQIVLENPDFKDPKFKLEEYCKKPNIESKLKNVCTYNEKLRSQRSWYDFNDTAFSTSLKNMIGLYSAATTEKADQQMVNAKLSTLLETIPKSAEPDVVLNIAENFSPETLNSLNGINTQISKCLSKKISQTDLNCKTPYLKLSADENSKILNELNLASAKFTYNDKLSSTEEEQRKLFQADTEINSFLNSKLNQAFQSIVEPTSHNETLEKLVKLSTNLDSSEIQTLDRNLKKYFPDKNINFKSQMDDFGSKCGNQEVINDFKNKKEELEDRLSECSNMIQNIADQFKSEDVQKIEAEIQLASNALRTKMNSNETRKNHTLQNYIANKYYRECSSDKVKQVPEIIQGCTNDPLSPLTNFKILDSAYPIIGKITKATSTDAYFTKEEMKEYNEACKQGYDSDLELVCKNIKLDFDKVKNIKSDADWEKIHAKNWVIYDEKDPRGYRVIEKKSNARILAEAIVPTAVNFIPFWMQDYSARMNIEAMGQQALYQKQWMWDMNQANNYWMSNMYYQYNPATVPTTTGFNFGK